MTPHLVLIVLVGVSVAVVRAALGDRYRGQRAALQEQAAASGVDRHVQRWNRLPFVAGDGDRLAHELTGRIDWEALELGDEPRILLREHVAEVTRFLADPTFDRYLRLKTEGVVFELSLADRWHSRG